jgi:hypothetical protein
MSTNTKTVHRATAVLSPPKPVSTLITYTRSVVTRMTGSALFPAPVPALAVVLGAVARRPVSRRVIDDLTE